MDKLKDLQNVVNLHNKDKQQIFGKSTGNTICDLLKLFDLWEIKQWLRVISNEGRVRS